MTFNKMPPSGPPTEQEIWNIARRTTGIIESKITGSVYLFGSAASSLWVDIGRVPNDIDIVVSGGLGGIWEQLDSEEIKEGVVRADNRYFLEPSRKRGATHHLLYCRLPGWRTDRRCVKVDILVPPTLGLPDNHYLNLINGIPVMPIFDLLIMKTQGWWDHRTSPRADFRAKENTDVSDIFALLERAVEENFSYLDEADEYTGRHSPEFLDHALTLVSRFVRKYGRHRQWRALEFPV